MVDYMFWIWLGIIVFAVMVEIITMDLVTVWFAAGGIVTLFLSLIPALDWPWQILIFVMISATLMLSLRKLTKKSISKKSEGKTNMDLVIGTYVKMLTPYTENEAGSVKIDGIIWTAIEKDRQSVAAGEKVKIIDVQGNKLIVDKKGEN